MTDEKLLLSKIQQLPEQLKQDVLNYVEFLQSKYARHQGEGKIRKAGSSAGKYDLAPDFDAPLEDFKEYM